MKNIMTILFSIIDSSKSNIVKVFSLQTRRRHCEKIRKTVGYDIITGQKITRLTKKPKNKTTKRRTFNKPDSKQKKLFKKNSKNI